MKKIVFNGILLFAFGMCLLTSCGISVKGENGQTYDSYQECCAANDYQAAHAYLAKMENAVGDDWDKEREFEEAREYVFKQEALFLMSQEDETAKKRLIYLLKEEGGNNDHVAMLIDLAIENDDEEFVKKLANQYSHAREQDLKKLINYLSSKSHNDNKRFLMDLLSKLDKRNLLLDVAINNNDIDFILENSDLINIYDNEIVSKLSLINNKRISDIVISSMASDENRIPQRPSIGKVNAGYSNGYNQFRDDCEKYISAVKSYNNLCRSIMNVAISNKNLYLAQKVKSKFKSSIEYQRWDNPKDTYFWFIVSIDNNEINEANKTFQDAVRSGAFK